MEIKKYVVIGGQYEHHFYGTTDSLQGAKVLASRNEEFWDNWKGWNTPMIYAGKDCRIIETKGMITYPDGREIIVPEEYARPMLAKRDGRWVEVK